jgi:hypothetical protein
MKKFWRWMCFKGYSIPDKYGEDKLKNRQEGHYFNEYISPSPLMLIGYMLEYVRDHESGKQLSLAPEDFVMSPQHYALLESIIKELDDEHVIIRDKLKAENL